MVTSLLVAEINDLTHGNGQVYSPPKLDLRVKIEGSVPLVTLEIAANLF